MIGEAAFERPALRSDDDKFSFKSKCFSCGQPAMAGNKGKGFDVISVRTIELKDTVLTVCQERNDGHIVYWHEFQVLMTCMQQMQSTTKLVISIFEH